MMYLVSVDYTWKLTRKRSRRGHQSSAFKKNQLYIQADINIFKKKLPLPFSQVQTKQKARRLSSDYNNSNKNIKQRMKEEASHCVGRVWVILNNSYEVCRETAKSV